MRTKTEKSRMGRWMNMIIAMICVSISCLVVSVYPNYKEFSYTDMAPFVGAEITYAKGGTSSVEGTEFGPINKGDRIVMEVALPSEKMVEPAILAFGINHAVVQVYHRDRLLYSYGEDIDARGDMICHHTYLVDVPREAWGESLTVCLRATENKAFNRVAHLWLYPAEKAYHFFFDLEFGRLVISFSVLAISLITLVAIPFLLRYDKRFLKLMFVALFGIVSSTWMLLAEGLQQFFEIDSYLLTTFEFITLASMVIPLGGYVLLEEKNPSRRTSLLLLEGIDIAYVVTICILNFSNICHFSVTVSATIWVIVLNAAVFIWHSLHNMDIRAAAQYPALLGVAALCFSGIFDVMRFSLYRAVGKSEFNQTQETFPMGVLIFFVFLLISAIISDREMQEQKRKNREKLLAGQIQPHFLFNTLASIREIIFDDPNYAAEILSDFTVYLRGAVRAMSDVEAVPFEEELRNIKAYAEIQEMRMQGLLRMVYQIDAADFVVPPFSLQPLVENAIRHGVFQRGREGGTVTVHSYEKNGGWIVEISDTGVGFDVKEVLERSKKKDCPSAGLKNVMSRLCESFGASFTVHSEPGVGTNATVFFPKKENRKISREQL